MMHGPCDTGTSGQRRSDGNNVLVRFLDSQEGDGACAVFAGVHLLYRITSHMIVLLKSPTVKEFTANNLRGSVRYLRWRLEHRIVRGSVATARSTDRLVDGAVRAVAPAAARSVRHGPCGLSVSSLVALRRIV